MNILSMPVAWSTCRYLLGKFIVCLKKLSQKIKDLELTKNKIYVWLNTKILPVLGLRNIKLSNGNMMVHLITHQYIGTIISWWISKNCWNWNICHLSFEFCFDLRLVDSRNITATNHTTFLMFTTSAIRVKRSAKCKKRVS